MLCGFGFVFLRAAQIGNQCDMDKQAVLPAGLQRDLTDSFYKGLGLDVADGAADFSDDHIGAGLFSDPVDKVLDLVCDVGNHLHGGAQVFAAALFVQDVPVNFTCRQIRVFVQVLVDETLVVAKVQIRLRSVLRDINFSVLIGTHGPRINVDIGIKLLCRHLQAPGLQKPPQGSGGDSLSQAGDHTSGHKNIFRHRFFLLTYAQQSF